MKLILKFNLKREKLNLEIKILKIRIKNVKLMNINEKYNVLLLRYESQEIIIQSPKDKLKLQTQEIEQCRTEIFRLHLQLSQLDVIIQELDQSNKQMADAYLLRYIISIQINSTLKSLTSQQKLVEIPIINISQKIEKLRKQNIQVQQKIDDKLEDQKDELSTNQVLRQELTKQTDINTQLIKDVSNADRKKQNIVRELQLLQAIEQDYQQLQIAYLNKQKESDKIKMQSDQIKFKQKDIENAIHSSNQLGSEKKNEKLLSI